MAEYVRLFTITTFSSGYNFPIRNVSGCVNVSCNMVRQYPIRDLALTDIGYLHSISISPISNDSGREPEPGLSPACCDSDPLRKVGQ